MDSNSVRLAQEENTRILNELIDFMRNGSLEFRREYGVPGNRAYRWEVADDMVILFEPASDYICDGDYTYSFPISLLDMSREQIDAQIIAERERREAESLAAAEERRAEDFERRRQHYETLKKEFENG